MNNKQEISDELLASYIEGNVTDEERALVEQNLAQDGELLDAMLTAHADVVYDQVIRRMNEETFWRRTRFYLIGVCVLAIIGCMSFFIWRFATPLQMRVNLTEDQERFIPALPFEQGTLTCEYADNAVQTFNLTADDKTIFLDDISYKYRKSDVHIVFEANGYETIDTIVPVQKAFGLNISRNNDLGIVFGRVADFVTGEPVANASVKLLDMETETDAFGQFKLEIPFGKQDKTQRVTVMKEGYPLWEGFYRPSATEPWIIILGEEQ